MFRDELALVKTRVQRLQISGEDPEQTESKLIVSDARKADRIEAAVAAACDGLFESEFAEATARRFEESAFVLAESGRGDDANVCLAAAGAFRAMPGGENPVARALMEQCLSSFLTSLRDKEEEGDGEGADESLIVEP